MINGRKESRPVHNATPLCPCPPSPTPTLNQRNPHIPMVVEVGKSGQGKPAPILVPLPFFSGGLLVAILSPNKFRFGLKDPRFSLRMKYFRGHRISLWLVRGQGCEAFKNIPIISSQEASLSENILYHASCQASWVNDHSTTIP